MPRGAKTSAAPRGEAPRFLSKGMEFRDAAARELSDERYDAAMLAAVHAVISANDAVTAVLAGIRSTDPDHKRAADLLEEVSGGSPEVRLHVRQLRELLARKNVVEYESRRATKREAVDASNRAGRFVAWAQEVVDRARA